MKCIIAGSRSIIDYQIVLDAVDKSGFTGQITEVVSGCAKGVDKLGERFAADCRLPVRRFPADWQTYGRSAGLIRNNDMARYADALIAVWDGKSRGTAHMIDIATHLKLRLYVHRIDTK